MKKLIPFLLFFASLFPGIAFAETSEFGFNYYRIIPSDSVLNVNNEPVPVNFADSLPPNISWDDSSSWIWFTVNSTTSKIIVYTASDVFSLNCLSNSTAGYNLYIAAGNSTAYVYSTSTGAYNQSTSNYQNTIKQTCWASYSPSNSMACYLNVNWSGTYKFRYDGNEFASYHNYEWSGVSYPDGFPEPPGSGGGFSNHGHGGSFEGDGTYPVLHYDSDTGVISTLSRGGFSWFDSVLYALQAISSAIAGLEWPDFIYQGSNQPSVDLSSITTAISSFQDSYETGNAAVLALLSINDAQNTVDDLLSVFNIVFTTAEAASSVAQNHFPFSLPYDLYSTLLFFGATNGTELTQVEYSLPSFSVGDSLTTPELDFQLDYTQLSSVSSFTYPLSVILWILALVSLSFAMFNSGKEV